MKGPFFAERDMCYSKFLTAGYGAVYDESLGCETWCFQIFQYQNANCQTAFSLLAPAADDQCIGPLVVARLVSARRLSPWSDRVAPAGGLAFAAAVGVVDRVHRHAAVGGIDALPAVAAGFADADVFVVGIANLADGGHALHQHLARLARGQLQQRIVAFLRHQVDLCAGRTRHLRAFARTQLDVVHDRSQRNVLQRKRIADQNVGFGSAHDLLSDLQANRLDDVALLAIRVVNQRDARAAVRIVLNGRDSGRDAVLVTLEVDQAKVLLVASALVADGHAARRVPSAGARLDREQRLMRLVRGQVVVHQLGLEAKCRGNRSK